MVDFSRADQVSSRSDTLNNSDISATSNHTIAFTLQNSLVSQSAAVTSSLTLTFNSGFNLAGLTCNDIDLLINGTATGFNVFPGITSTWCPNTATAWGVSIDNTNHIITITTPAAVHTPSIEWAATTTPITILIGSNATFQGNGSNWIYNPSTPGQKNIAISGTFGGSGQIATYVISSVTFSASIGETLIFTIAGLPGQYNGSDKMAGCVAASSNTVDDEDARFAFMVTTTATTVPFGTLTLDDFSEGCQRLGVQTNASNGYTIYSRENNPLETSGGLVLDDLNCQGTGGCTPTTTNTFWSQLPGLGISCVNSATSASCSTANPNWNAGQNWAPIAAESKGLSPAKFSGVVTVTSGTIFVKIKYRLQALSGQQAPGTYTNKVS